MHRVPVQARFAPSSRRLRPPRSSSPEAVHGVKPPRSTPRRCRVDCDQTSSEGSCQRSSGGTPELSPLTLIPSVLPSGVGRHVVCAPRSLSEHRRRAGPHCSSAWDPRGNHQDPLYFLSPRGVSGKGAGNCFSGSSATGDAVQIAAPSFFFRGTPSAANSAPKLSSLRDRTPQNEPRDPCAYSAGQWSGLGVHCLSGWTGVGIAGRSLTERLPLPSASGHAPRVSMQMMLV
ncbi:hypothetical protein NDU88_003763 [Pleurodeles waltl]|uniref:Uncharacterized protein n=1 Tax=Pleurodeles waltl TaxID=8319 RepID=A0AAV7T6I3_PLEWA|nr:hypothetical protein NDU88_003763 [Pleurodeles waltl]